MQVQNQRCSGGVMRCHADAWSPLPQTLLRYTSLKNIKFCLFDANKQTILALNPCFWNIKQ